MVGWYSLSLNGPVPTGLLCANSLAAELLRFDVGKEMLRQNANAVGGQIVQETMPPAASVITTVDGFAFDR